jgi:methyl-accepting chemotaxis protein
MTDPLHREERLRFLHIDATTRASLVEFRPQLEKHVQAILGKFYAHIGQYPELASKFKDGAVPRAKAAQANHWMGLFEGKFDEAYVERVRRIGKTHEMIDLEPRWYIGGYALAMNELMAVAVAEYRKKPEKLTAILQSMVKALFLDMDYAISIYIDEGKATHQKQMNALAESFEGSVLGLVEKVSAAAASMKETAQSMSGVAEDATQRATTVAAAAEETRQNVQTVASATEELSASIGEIGNRIGESSRIVSEAVSQADETNHKVAGLSDAAQKIGEVVRLISDIAGQTNLLALNATIEAARAGDAGKGFAVVASEVKQLATQTARATEQISGQVQAIQSAVGAAAQAILQITNTINRVNEISTAIASAVEEQAAATQEISRNVQQASAGTSQVSTNIGSVSEAARQTGRSASQVLGSASDLTQSSTQLRGEVDGFLRKIRA